MSIYLGTNLLTGTTGSGGSTTFIGLTDVPEPDYLGHARQGVIVNDDETGLVFENVLTEAPSAGPTITALTYGAFATSGNPGTTFTPNIHTHANLTGDEVQIEVTSLARPGVINPTIRTTFHLQDTVGGNTYTEIPLANISYVDSDTVNLVLPARAAGVYNLVGVNPGNVDGNLFAVTYSAGPQWQTPETLSFGANAMVSTVFSATGAVDYTITTAPSPALPSYLTLMRNQNIGDTNGNISLMGTVPADDGMQTAYTGTFTITARDADNDTIERTFTLSVSFGLEVSYLLVAGGGRGGQSTASGGSGSGGGAGGVLQGTALELEPGTFTVTVGTGGNNVQLYASQSDNGGNSVLSGPGITTLTAIGGGGGGSHGGTTFQNGRNGGSGGGASSGATPGQGTAGQGNAGNAIGTGGHGGGAGGAATATNSGIGVTTTVVSAAVATAQAIGEVSGSDVYFASGGRGFDTGQNSSAVSLGGGASIRTPSRAALPNSGGGGSAGDGAGSRGGARTQPPGADGVFVLNFEDAAGSRITPANATTTTPISVGGGRSVYIWKTSGSFMVS